MAVVIGMVENNQSIRDADQTDAVNITDHWVKNRLTK